MFATFATSARCLSHVSAQADGVSQSGGVKESQSTPPQSMGDTLVYEGPLSTALRRLKVISQKPSSTGYLWESEAWHMMNVQQGTLLLGMQLRSGVVHAGS